MEDFDFSFDSEEIKESVKRYEDMIRKSNIGFFDTDVFISIVDHYIDRNEPYKALQVTEHAISQHPYSVEIMLKQAQLYSLVNDYPSALKSLDKAESISPSEAGVYMIRGSIYSQQAKYDSAIESFKKAIPYSEALDELYLNMAFVYESSGSYRNAISSLKKVLEENPDRKSVV